MTAALKATAQEDIFTIGRIERYDREAGELAKKGNVGFTDREPYVKRWQSLKKIRAEMEPVWRDVRYFILPTCGRYLVETYPDPDSESYNVNYSYIIDSSPTKMLLTAADGLHGGLTDQSEPWFSYYIGDYRRYRESFSAEAREYVTNAQECVRDTLAVSNFYTAIYSFYLELIGFGTALMLINADYTGERARYFTKTSGSYWLDHDDSQRVDTAYVQHAFRAADIVRKYGKDNCPDRVTDCLSEHGNPDKKFIVIQCIQPWNYFGRNGRHQEFRFEDVHFVAGGDAKEKILFRGGYRTKPFVASRWADSGDYVYSRSCPGIDALPDVKQLQSIVLDYNKVVKWKSDPAFVTTANDITDILPGHIYTCSGDPRQDLLIPIVTPDYDIPANLQAATEVRERISAQMYNREFLLVQSRQRQITATEVNQLIQEKNTVLGPIVARVGNNTLIPALDRTFEINTVELRILPPAPEEIQGLDIKPYFSGKLAQAQRQSGAMTKAANAFQFAGNAMAIDQTCGVLFDVSAAARELDEVDAFPAGFVRPQQEVEQLRQQQQQVMQQQQQAAALQQGVEMAKSAGQANTSQDTLLGQLMGGGEGVA